MRLAARRIVSRLGAGTSVTLKSVPRGLLALGSLKAMAPSGLPFQRKPVRVYGRVGDLEVRLARTRRDIKRAQRLRYQVFYEEMSAVPSLTAQMRRRDEDAYCARFGLTEGQRRAVKSRNVLALLDAGGNIYYLAKWAGIFGMNVQDLGAQQRGMTVEEFVEMLIHSGGR